MLLILLPNRITERRFSDTDYTREKIVKMLGEIQNENA